MEDKNTRKSNKKRSNAVAQSVHNSSLLFQSLLIKEDVDMVPEAEQQQQKSLKCLPKTAINALTEEALSIVIKTERSM